MDFDSSRDVSLLWLGGIALLLVLFAAAFWSAHSACDHPNEGQYLGIGSLALYAVKTRWAVAGKTLLLLLSGLFVIWMRSTTPVWHVLRGVAYLGAFFVLALLAWAHFGPAAPSACFSPHYP